MVQADWLPVVSQFEFRPASTWTTSLDFAYYNFCRIRVTLRATPARAVDLTDRVGGIDGIAVHPLIAAKSTQ